MKNNFIFLLIIVLAVLLSITLYGCATGSAPTDEVYKAPPDEVYIAPPDQVYKSD